jgi:hypothetical protein
MAGKSAAKKKAKKVRKAPSEAGRTPPPAETDLAVSDLMMQLRPKRRITLQKSIRFEKNVLETAIALCWWKRTDFTLWLERALAEKIVEELSAEDIDISHQELVAKYRAHVNSDLQKAGALASLYDETTEE